MARSTHGMSKTKTYRIWVGMVDRIEHSSGYKASRYRLRGITISPKLRTFEGFLSILGTCPKGMGLDRINPNGNYEEGNVRWATRSQQSRNRTNTLYFEFRGKRQCINDWAEELKVPRKRLHSRLIRDKWPVERAFTEAPRKYSRPQEWKKP